MRVLLVVCVMSGIGVGRSALAAQPIVFSDQAVQNAIDKGKAYVWSHYNPKGHTKFGNPWNESWYRPDGKHNVKHNIFSGHTALAVYALLVCGESHQDDRMKHAIDWLVNTKTVGTYPLAIRAQIWALLPPDIGRKLLMQDADLLVRSISRPAPGQPVQPGGFRQYGSYSYVSNGTGGGSGDNSNSQFGVLGVWAAARSGVEIPKEYWQFVYKHWEDAQMRDGGWSYGNSTDNHTKVLTTSRTMVPAGLASLFIAIDNLNLAEFTRCGRQFEVKPIARAMKLLDKNLAGGIPKINLYYFYGIERVGFASGYKYFGQKDWYKVIATEMINHQRPNGDLGSGVADTCLGLLFLARGRSPLLMNRLQYDGDWNNRPRALANLTNWVGREFEREVNWQIIDIEAPVAEWHDSEVLAISGSEAPKFSDGQLDKLRRFAQEGGTLFSVAECGSQGLRFDKAMREHYAKMFPAYELTLLPPEHPVYKIHFPLGRAMRVWGVSNGVRMLALHTTTDVTLSWQRNMYATQGDMFKLGTNVAFFVNDHELGHARGVSPWPTGSVGSTNRKVSVCRVRYSGNYDPEPLALERFGLLMGQRWGTLVTVGPATGFAELDAKKAQVAFLTGTGELVLSAGEKQGLKRYVESGGTLVADAGGGGKAFAAGVSSLLEELFGSESLRRLGSLDELYNLPGMAVKDVSYRSGAAGRVADQGPNIWGVAVGGRTGVFFTRYDLTTGLLGCPVHGCVGYSPDSSLALVRNMVLYASGVRKSPSPASASN